MLAGKCTLGTLSFPPQLLQGALVAADIHAVLALDQLDEVLHDTLVKVLATQVSVTCSSQMTIGMSAQPSSYDQLAAATFLMATRLLLP